MSIIYDYIVTKLNTNMLGSIATSFFWYLIGNALYYYNNCDFKIGRLLTSASHALTVILFYLFGGPVWLLCYLSQGYYIMDTLYELVILKRSGSLKLYQLGMVAHHVITYLGLTFLLDPLTQPYIFQAYFLAEVSNLPLYSVRFLNYKKYDYKYITHITNSIIFLELIAYIYFRMILCGPVVYSVVMNALMPVSFKAMTISMYIISGMWTYKLWKQTLNIMSY